ncbi:BnaA03g57320D, partial [Brassica napus]
RDPHRSSLLHGLLLHLLPLLLRRTRRRSFTGWWWKNQRKRHRGGAWARRFRGGDVSYVCLLGGEDAEARERGAGVCDLSERVRRRRNAAANLAEQVAVEPDLELQEVGVDPEPVVDASVPEQSVTNEVDSRRLPGVPVDVKRVKFSRSHTTGHSVVQPGECTERFTLRLPEDVRKRMVENWKLNRSDSLTRGGSSRRGKPIDRSRAWSDRWLFRKTPSFLWRSRDDGSIRLGATGSVRGNAVVNSTGDSVRSDRWAFLRNGSFLWRNSSVHVPRGGVNKDGEGTSVKSTGAGGSTSGSVRIPV